MYEHGQLISGVASTCLHHQISTLTVKALLIILPKYSLIESNGKQKKKKQLRKVKIKLKSHGGPKKFGGLGEGPGPVWNHAMLVGQ